MVDLIIFSVGAVFSLFFLLIIPDQSLKILLLKLAPLLIALLLVMPIPNYHNMLCVIKDILSFYSNRRVYLWKGWCVLDDTDKK